MKLGCLLLLLFFVFGTKSVLNSAISNLVLGYYFKKLNVLHKFGHPF